MKRSRGALVPLTGCLLAALAATQAFPVNLVPNPGFEIAANPTFPDGWTTYPNQDFFPYGRIALDSEAPFEGSRSLRVEVVPLLNLGAPFPSPFVSCYRIGTPTGLIRLPPGPVAYTLSAWLKGKPAGKRVLLSVTCAGNRSEREVVLEGEWRRHQLTFAPPAARRAGPLPAEVAIAARDADEPHVFRVDAVQLEPGERASDFTVGPEPGPEQERVPLPCPRAQEPPRIDGCLTDPCWSQAARLPATFGSRSTRTPLAAPTAAAGTASPGRRNEPACRPLDPADGAARKPPATPAARPQPESEPVPGIVDARLAAGEAVAGIADARLLRDRGDLCVSFRCHGPIQGERNGLNEISAGTANGEGDVRIQLQAGRRTAPNATPDVGGSAPDAVRILLQAGRDETSWAWFRLDAGGTKSAGYTWWDELSQLAGEQDFDAPGWACAWAAAVRVDRHGWSAEARIPFRCLGRGDDEPVEWGFNLCREHPGSEEESCLVPAGSRDDPGLPSFCLFTGAKVLPPSPTFPGAPLPSAPPPGHTEGPGTGAAAPLEPEGRDRRALSSSVPGGSVPEVSAPGRAGVLGPEGSSPGPLEVQAPGSSSPRACEGNRPGVSQAGPLKVQAPGSSSPGSCEGSRPGVSQAGPLEVQAPASSSPGSGEGSRPGVSPAGPAGTTAPEAWSPAPRDEHPARASSPARPGPLGANTPAAEAPRPGIASFLDRDYYTTERTAVLRISLPREAFAGTLAEGGQWRIEVLGPLLEKPFTAPASLQEVSLRIPLGELLPGSYGLEVQLTGPDGKTHSSRTLSLERLRPSAREVKVDRYLRCLRVEGEPFFPYLFGASSTAPWPHLIEEAAAAGFNGLILPFEVYGQRDTVESIRLCLDRCREAGLGVVFWLTPDEPGAGLSRRDPRFVERQTRGLEAAIRRLVPAFRDHPALLAWLFADEWWDREATGRLYRLCRQLDPYRPAFHNQTGGTAVLRRHPEWLGGEDLGTDILSWDVYPFGGIDRPDRLRQMLDESIRQVMIPLAGPRRLPMMFWQQMFNLYGRLPTPREYLAEAYLLAMYGVRGLYTFFHKPEARELWEAAGAFGTELERLRPVFLAGPPAAGEVRHSGPIRWLAAKGKDGDYLVAVNLSAREHTGRLDPARGNDTWNSGRVEVLFESRSLEPSGGTLEDRFLPRQRHVYRWVPRTPGTAPSAAAGGACFGRPSDRSDPTVVLAGTPPSRLRLGRVGQRSGKDAGRKSPGVQVGVEEGLGPVVPAEAARAD